MTGELSEQDLERMSRSGTPPLTTEQGLALFDAALTVPRAAVAPARLDLAVLRGHGEVPPLLRGLIRTRTRRTVRTGSEAALSLAQRLSRLDEESRAEAVVDLVRTQTATVLGHASAHDIDPERPFQELGFDSLTAVELRNRLAAATGLRTSATVTFDYPTVAALAGHLLRELTDTAPETAAPDAGTPTRATADDPIVVVGMSCRYPGGVTSPTTCGAWSPRAPTPSADCPSTAAGTSTTSTTPTRTTPAPPTPVTAASCTTRASSTPASSA